MLNRKYCVFIIYIQNVQVGYTKKHTFLHKFYRHKCYRERWLLSQSHSVSSKDIHHNFFLININTRLSLSNFCSNGCVLHGFAVFRICPIPPTRALHLDYVDLFHIVRLICIYDICAFSLTFEASFNTPIQEKTGSCREARSKGPSAFAAQYLLSKKFQVNVEDVKFTVNQAKF